MLFSGVYDDHIHLLNLLNVSDEIKIHEGLRLFSSIHPKNSIDDYQFG